MRHLLKQHDDKRVVCAVVETAGVLCRAVGLLQRQRRETLAAAVGRPEACFGGVWIGRCMGRILGDPAVIKSSTSLCGQHCERCAQGTNSWMDDGI